MRLIADTLYSLPACHYHWKVYFFTSETRDMTSFDSSILEIPMLLTILTLFVKCVSGDSGSDYPVNRPFTVYAGINTQIIFHKRIYHDLKTVKFFNLTLSCRWQHTRSLMSGGICQSGYQETFQVKIVYFCNVCFYSTNL